MICLRDALVGEIYCHSREHLIGHQFDINRISHQYLGTFSQEREVL